MIRPFGRGSFRPKNGEKINVYAGGKISGGVKDFSAALNLQSGQGAFVTFE